MRDQTDRSQDFWLSGRQQYSNISDLDIRRKFEERQHYMGLKDFSRNELSGVYLNDMTQHRWEEFYNGFRECEDYVPR